MIKNTYIRYPFLVQLINLNEPGDARFTYLNHSDSPITVKVFYQQGEEPDKDITLWIQDMITQTTNKSSQVIVLAHPISTEKESYSKADLNNLRSENITPSVVPTLNIMYVSTYTDTPSYAGITLHRDTLFIFKDALRNLTTHQKEQSELEKSTLMHEWGHLLGLNHNDFPQCIMSSVVDVPQDRPGTKNNINTTYCWNELYELSEIRKLAF